MKKLIICILLFYAPATFLLAQDCYNIDRKVIPCIPSQNGLYEFYTENYTDFTIHKVHYKDGKKHGLYEKFYSNRKLQESINYDNDQKHGLHQTFYNRGKLHTTVNYVKDQKQGLYQAFHENGALKEKVNYINDQKDGLYESFHFDKSVHITVNYSNGKRQGLYQSFHSNGQIQEKGNYIEGERQGLYQSFHENGQLHVEVNYTNGKKNGLYQAFHPNGQLHAKVNYINDLKEGIYQAFHPDGQLQQSINYDKDIANGLYKLFYENGQLQERTNYKQGKKNGAYQSFYKNGYLKQKSKYKEDKRHGAYDLFYRNGNQESFYYDKGKWFRLYQSFHENGRLREKKIYIYNKMIFYEAYSNYGELESKLNTATGKTESYYTSPEPYMPSIDDFIFIGYNFKNYHLHKYKLKEYFYDNNKNILLQLEMKGEYSTFSYYHEQGYLLHKESIYPPDKDDDKISWDALVYEYKHGLCISYYDNGQVKTQVLYDNNRRSGTMYIYYNTGAIKEEINHRDSYIVGLHTFYDEAGNIIKRIDYSDNFNTTSYIEDIYYCFKNATTIKYKSNSNEIYYFLSVYKRDFGLEHEYYFQNNTLYCTYKVFYDFFNENIKYNIKFKVNASTKEVLTHYTYRKLALQGQLISPHFSTASHERPLINIDNQTFKILKLYKPDGTEIKNTALENNPDLPAEFNTWLKDYYILINFKSLY